jgi:hypothetical protein
MVAREQISSETQQHSLSSYFRELFHAHPSRQLAHLLLELDEVQQEQWENPHNKALKLGKIVRDIGAALPAEARSSREFQDLQSNLIRQIQSNLPSRSVQERVHARTARNRT